MSRIFLTGDTHGSLEINRLSFNNFPVGHELTKDDYVIVLGDFGVIWDGSKTDQYWLKWLDERPFLTLFISGNHENYDLLETYPTEQWHGGNTRIINNSVRQLMNGEIFNINNLDFFIMGGATSTDKWWRKEHVSWWPQEIPSNAEFQNGVDNLAAHNNKVDFILSHCAPSEFLPNATQHDEVNQYLSFLWKFVDFQAHCCGHYHIDKSYGKLIVLYKDIIEIKENMTDE